MPYKMTEKQKEFQRIWIANKRKTVLLNLLKGKVCSRCGFDDIRALCFHHRNRSEKEFTIGQILSLKKETILKEIEKCDLICANCHSIEHSRFHPDGAYR